MPTPKVKPKHNIYTVVQALMEGKGEKPKGEFNFYTATGLKKPRKGEWVDPRKKK